MWGDAKVKKLSQMKPSGVSLWLYLLTCPHTTAVPGLYRAGRAQLAEDLGWPLHEFDRCLGELVEQDMVRADWNNRVVWIVSGYKNNPPQNPDQVRGWRHYLPELPECELKDRALEHFREQLSQRSIRFVRALDYAMGVRTLLDDNDAEEPAKNHRRPPRKAAKRAAKPGAAHRVKTPAAEGAGHRVTHGPGQGAAHKETEKETEREI